MRTHYGDLLARLCTHLRLSDVQGLRRSGRLRVAGHDLLLHFDEALDACTLQARLDLGAAPAEQQEAVWHRLLVSNFDWSAGGVLGWGMTPEAQHIVLTAQFGFDEHTTGAEFAAWLRDLAAAALSHWQTLLSSESWADSLPPAALQSVLNHETPPGLDWPALMKELRAHCGCGDSAESMPAWEALCIEGMDMALGYDEQAPGRFELRADLGLDLARPRHELWQGLLKNNFVTGLNGRMSFSLHPESGSVVLALQHDLPGDATAPDLADLLREIATHGKRFWTQACIPL